MWYLPFSECSDQFSKSELKKRVCKQSDGSPGICCKDVSEIRQPNLGGQKTRVKDEDTESPEFTDEYDYDVGVKSGGSRDCSSE